MLRHHSTIIFCLVWFHFALLAQTDIPGSQTLIENLAEEIGEGSEYEPDLTSLTEDLNYYLRYPLNINTATVEDLEKLHFLTDFQIKSLLYYIRDHGELQTVYELNYILGFSQETVRSIFPFITVSKPEFLSDKLWKQALKNGDHAVVAGYQQVIEKQKGYLRTDDSLGSDYPGSRYKLCTRYRFDYNEKYYWGLTAEKDAGEEFFKGSQKQGFDFNSAYFQVNHTGICKTFLLGDYHVQFGQGLVLWHYAARGKSADVMNMRRKAQGIKRYTSADENRFMRGAATTLQYGNWSLSTFFSRKKTDANVLETDSLTGSTISFSSLQYYGIHATTDQINDKDAVDETIFGGNINYEKEYYRIGVTMAHYFFDADYSRNIKPYNRFEFQESSNTNAGADYCFMFRKLSLFGETAVSENFSYATLNGATLTVIPEVSLSLLQRFYPKDYQSLYGHAFGENSKNANEKGIYLGTTLNFVSGFSVSAYYDVYSSPWLSYNTDAPSYGNDYLIQADYSPSPQVQMYGRIKKETCRENLFFENWQMNKTGEISRMSLRYHISFSLFDALTLRNRIELTEYKMENGKEEHGYLIYQDVIYKRPEWPLTFSCRYAMFDTKSFYTAIYSYEQDVLYAWSVPSYFNRGTRFYLLLRYSPFSRLDIYFRFAQTHYVNIHIIGSGLDEIQGDRKSEVKILLRVQF